MLNIDFYRPNFEMDVKQLVDRLIDLSFAEDILLTPWVSHTCSSRRMASSLE